jgi:hypothetical protein
MLFEEEVIRIAKRYTFPKQSCSLNTAYADEGDFCDCNIINRRISLATDIQILLNAVRKSQGV